MTTKTTPKDEKNCDFYVRMKGWMDLLLSRSATTRRECDTSVVNNFLDLLTNFYVFFVVFEVGSRNLQEKNPSTGHYLSMTTRFSQFVKR